MKKNLKGALPLFLFLMISSFILIIFFNSFGTVKLSFKDILLIFFNKNPNKIYTNIILNIRLPRVLGSFITGAILAISGNILQLIIQNPLADPYILGISSGASFGAVIYSALTMIYAIKLPFGMESTAFFFGVFSTILVFLIAKEGKKIPILSLILSGVIVSFLFNSITTLFTVMYWKNLIHVNIWLMGSTASLTWKDCYILLFVLFLQIITSLLFSKQLNVLSMGEHMAVYSGINPEKIKIILIGINVLAVSIAVSKTGIIGFVGLVIPHIVRKVTGPYSSVSTFYSLFVGGSFLAASDFVSRTIFAPTELPIGVVTSIIGAPVFIYILKRERKND
ncbi:iron(III) ABC transporter permease [Tepiditoga spiralis]|uniref:Iron(III) ABC transporter permease n=1 Tax=Tepiditoga spiralis TaxID=2108365 RepID=A0A7G1G4M9_9BACT|nr:iron(III) ABC transporter permease [Tepiditoga spiralis]